MLDNHHYHCCFWHCCRCFLLLSLLLSSLPLLWRWTWRRKIGGRIEAGPHPARAWSSSFSIVGWGGYRMVKNTIHGTGWKSEYATTTRELRALCWLGIGNDTREQVRLGRRYIAQAMGTSGKKWSTNCMHCTTTRRPSLPIAPRSWGPSLPMHPPLAPHLPLHSSNIHSCQHPLGVEIGLLTVKLIFFLCLLKFIIESCPD